jgi:hypothetical protein
MFRGCTQGCTPTETRAFLFSTKPQAEALLMSHEISGISELSWQQLSAKSQRIKHLSFGLPFAFTTSERASE